jgi:hypothetical protein
MTADDRAKSLNTSSGGGLGSAFVEVLKETGDHEAVAKVALKQVCAHRLPQARARARRVKKAERLARCQHLPADIGAGLLTLAFAVAFTPMPISAPLSQRSSK